MDSKKIDSAWTEYLRLTEEEIELLAYSADGINGDDTSIPATGWDSVPPAENAVVPEVVQGTKEDEIIETSGDKVTTKKKKKKSKKKKKKKQSVTEQNGTENENVHDVVTLHTELDTAHKDGIAKDGHINDMEEAVAVEKDKHDQRSL